MFGWEYPPEVSGGLGIATHGLLSGLAAHEVATTFVLPTCNSKISKEKWRIVNASEQKVKVKEIIEEKYWERISLIETGSKLLPYISFDDFRILKKKESGISKKSSVLKESYQFKGGYTSTLMEEVSRLALVAAELSSTTSYDIIHGHDWMTFPAALAAGSKAGKPVILHVHSTEIERSFPHIDQEIYDLERKSFEQADHLIAVSNLTRDVLIKHFSIDPTKITVVHNSFSPTFKAPQAKKSKRRTKTVTFIGRMTRQKAPSLFVDVAKTLSDRDSNYRFVMAGDGYLLDDIKTKVIQLNLQKKFKFPGFINARKIKELLAKSDLFLFPASSEPFGMVALEAAASGVPVVLSNQTGAKEVLKSALTFECWETFKMADTITRALSDNSDLLKYRKKLQSEAANRSWDDAGRETVLIYEKLK